MSDPVLHIEGLTKRFGGITAVDNLSYTLAGGRLHAIIGPNGAGKTTLFNLITGIFPASSGQVLLFGRDVTAWQSHRRTAMGMARTFQITSLFPRLTVLENVRVALQRQLGTSFHFWRSQRSLSVLDARAMELLEAVDLRGYADAVTVELPYGRKRALELATTLALDPRMDRVRTDPRFQKWVHIER